MVDASSSDLNKPLGLPKAAKPRSPWPRRVGWALALSPFALVAAFAAFVTLVKDPEGGRPVTVVAIPEVAGATPQRQAQSPGADQPPQPGASPERQQANAGQVEQDSGVRVLRPGSEAPNSIVIRVPDQAAPVRLAPAPDRRLVERGKHGPLPRIGEDGARSSQIYARPAPPNPDNQPRIAILLGGLGISSSATADSISKLPAEISLAFAPYGSDLERQVQRARADGHEIFLQVPMEPFDYPDNDPGPHTLTMTATTAENLDRLHWVMARFPGYVGIVNFMGARFASNDAALAPIAREIAQRGLMVIDDGSSGRSQLTQAAGNHRAPAARADVVIDALQRGEAIDRELARLEQMARERGVSLGSASALPLTVERLQRWSRTLEARGIRLVPVSAVAAGRAQVTGATR